MPEKGYVLLKKGKKMPVLEEKMPRNIEKIELWRNNPEQYNNVPLVRIDFTGPCRWTVLDITDLLQILELWIIGEEEAYPPGKGYKGRLMLYDKIKEVFEKTEVKKNEME